MSALAQDHATLAAHIQGVDKVARAMEAKWGIDRLPVLVSDELRAKFMRQQARWRFALETAYDAPVITRDMLDLALSTSAAMQRAWQALDQAATADGHGPVSPDVWEAKRRDGTIVAIVRTNAEAVVAQTAGRYVEAYTLAEIANVLDALPETISRAKQIFPGAKVEPPRDRTWVKHGDGIPF